MKSVHSAILAILFIPLFASVANAQTTTISVADSQAAGKDETVVVDVLIDDAQDVGAYDYSLRFDPDILEYAGIDEGDFLMEGELLVDDKKVSEGLISVGVYSIGASDSGSGILSKVSFKALKSGSKSEVSIDDASVISSNIEGTETTPLTQGGSVVVGGSSGFFSDFWTWLRQIFSSFFS